MRIAEIFRSLQGEGRLTGADSVFVRTSGCNLRCGFCDTPYASWTPEGDELPVDQIVARVERLGGTHVVLTGGEPLLFAESAPLCAEFRRLGRHITIETAGTRYLPVACDLMSISPKLSNSKPLRDGLSCQPDAPWPERHELNRHRPEVIRRLVSEFDYQVKFVVDSPADCREVEAYLAQFPEIDRARAMLMPQGIDAEQLAAKAAWLRPYCLEHGLAYCPRRQIDWFGPQRGR